MSNEVSSSNLLLRSILSNEKMIGLGKYKFTNEETIDSALNSTNPVVRVVAMFIDDMRDKSLTDKEIYNELTNYLRSAL